MQSEAQIFEGICFHRPMLENIHTALSIEYSEEEHQEHDIAHSPGTEGGSMKIIIMEKNLSLFIFSGVPIHGLCCSSFC